MIRFLPVILAACLGMVSWMHPTEAGASALSGAKSPRSRPLLPGGEIPGSGRVTAVGDEVRLSGAVPAHTTRGALPLRFVRNDGQFVPEALARAQSRGYSLWLTKGAMVFDVTLPGGGERQVVRLDLLGANPEAALEMVRLAEGTASFLLGNDPARWRSGLPVHGEAVYREIYPDIDLRLYGNEGRVEYDFIVKPGGDPARIRMAYGGATEASLDETGDLHLSLSGGQLTHRKPRVYQNVEGEKVEIPAVFHQRGDGIVSFRVADYRSDRDLIIDPAVELTYSTYLGGTGEDGVTSLAVDKDGYIYIAGNTLSADFPVGANPPRTYQGGYDVFVSKLSPDGQSLVYSTYVGGSLSNPEGACSPDEFARGITVNASGEAHIAGITRSTDFPVVNGFQVHVDECPEFDGFVLRLSADGQTILYSTFLGSSWEDQIRALAMDKDGFVYVTGNTGQTPPTPFPEKNALYHCNQSRHPIFVSGLDTSKTGDESLIFSTCFGGNESWKGVFMQEANSIAVDDTGNIYIAGGVETADFPVTSNAYRPGRCVELGWGNRYHSFLSKFSPGGQSLLYSTCFGYPPIPDNNAAPGVSWATDLAVNSNGLAYVVGDSRDPQFPLKRQFLSNTGQSMAVYLSIFDTRASGEESLLASTYLGSQPPTCCSWLSPAGVSLDIHGDVYVLGTTGSPAVPVWDSFQNTYGGGDSDCFMSKVSGDGLWLYYNTYLGGNGDDRCTGINTSPAGSVVVAGHTNSTNFPTADPIQGAIAGGYDGFVSKVDFGSVPEGLSVASLVADRVFPGETVPITVIFRNDLLFDTQDTVVRLLLPKEARYLGSDPAGIYLSGGHEVFWRMGTIPAGTRGVLEVRVVYDWGIPAHHFSFVVAQIDAANAPFHPIPDMDFYLAHEPVVLVSEKAMSRGEIDALLASNPTLGELYQQIGGLGFQEFGVAREKVLSDGSTEHIIYLMAPESLEQVQLMKAYGEVFALRFDQRTGGFSAFDATGGFFRNLRENRWEGWGNWALESLEGKASLREADTTTGPKTQCEATTARCLGNCLAEVGYNFTLGKIFEILGKLGLGVSCTLCILDSTNENCYACQTELTKKLAEEIPGAGEAIDVIQCLLKCGGDPKTYVCSEDKLGCASGWDPYRSFMGYFNVQFRTIQRCNTTTCTWDPPEYIACPFGEACVDGACKPCHTVTGQGNCKKQEVITPHDPNLKHGPDGDLLPGEGVSYVIEYENVGEGTAYDVFIKDILDEHLDESTLVINDGGVYLAPLRTIYWSIGELAAHETGSVSFSVQTKPALSSGTTIANQAVVYFPTVREETPTNVRVNRVYTIVAHPQRLVGESGVVLPITLTGADSGGAGLTYRVVDGPVYGEVTGTAPSITYIAMDGFSGVDRFWFVANNGTVDSLPADVTIDVAPSPSDVTSPTVVFTHPASDAAGIAVSVLPLGENGYPPVISARFSESVDPATVTSDAFTVNGVTGAVNYDPFTWTAYFTPSVPLAHGTTYTATLTTGITDLIGNPMAGEHVWQFTTNSPVDMRVVLNPPEATGYDFGNVQIGSVSTAKVVTVQSSGTEDLVLGNLSVTGAGAGHFLLQPDSCSGQTLSPGQNCAANIAFGPQAGGKKSAVLSILSNDPDGSTAQVSLRGLGILANGGYADPGEGTLGTEFVLTGSGFGNKKGKVLVDRKKCTVLSWSDTAIGCRVSKPLTPGTYGITVFPREPRRTPPIGLPGAFTLMRPRVMSAPGIGSVGQEVAISGLYFGMPKKGKVVLGYTTNGKQKGKKCRVISWTMDVTTGASTARFRVPKLPSGVYDLTVSNKVESDTFAGGFTIP